MPPILVAFSGPSRSGKGTGARVFAQEAATNGLTSCERQLSGPGKHYLAKAWNPDISEEQAIAWWEGLKGEINTGILVRSTPKDASALGVRHEVHGVVSLQQYMQRMLQNARESWGDSFWIDKLIPRGRYDIPGNAAWMNSFDHGTDVAIISDLRQPNEAERVKGLGGIVIELVRPKNDDAYRTGKDHITEQGLPADLVDFQVNNTGTLEDLEGIFTAYFHHDLLPRIT